MVAGDIGFLIDRSNLELAGRHFVVAGFGRNTKLDKLVFHVFHEALHAGRNGTEVMVFQFLPLG